MTYLIIEMVALLLAALLIGLIIGWLMERWLRYQEIEALRQALRNTRLTYEQNERMLRHRVAELTHVAQSFKAQLLDAGIQPALPMPEGTTTTSREDRPGTVDGDSQDDVQIITADNVETVVAQARSKPAQARETARTEAEQPAADDTTARSEEAASSDTERTQETDDVRQETREQSTAASRTETEEAEAATETGQHTDDGKTAEESAPAASQASQSAAETVDMDEEWPYPVQEVEGIGPVYSKRLKEKGIVTTADLLEKTQSEEALTDVAKHVKVSPNVMRRWIHMCHLMKTPGIRGQYAKLLELAEVHDFNDLAKQSARSLTRRLRIVNEIHHITHQLPKESDVRAWIQFAKTHRDA